jgi:hypothetical protein
VRALRMQPSNSEDIIFGVTVVAEVSEDISEVMSRKAGFCHTDHSVERDPRDFIRHKVGSGSDAAEISAPMTLTVSRDAKGRAPGGTGLRRICPVHITSL